MAGDGPKWEGLLKWSLKHADGTRPSRELSEEDKKWLIEALETQSVDTVKRMKEITLVMKTPEQVLEAQGVTAMDIEEMLDELQEHVEAIDMANDLHAIGGLVPLLGYLNNPHAGIRAKAAEVVTTVVQNNPKSQQLVMEAGGMEPLMQNFSSDQDVTVRTKALGAISSLIRNNKLGLNSFRLASGYSALKDALVSDSVRFQKKALSLIEYLLQEDKADCSLVLELGFHRIFMHLASSGDPDLREGALRGLWELIRGGGTAAIITGANEDEKLKPILQQCIEGIKSMAPDDLRAAKEERQLVDMLWQACYKEPSSLREKELLVLPDEELPPPPVQVFEPSLRGLTSNPNPLLLGFASEETDPGHGDGPTDPHDINSSNNNQ